MRGYLLGIDVGTSACKCVLMDEKGAVIGEASREYEPLFSGPGASEQNPTDWVRAVFRSFRLLIRRTGADPRRIEAVGVTGQMRGLTFIGKSGAPIRNSILWNDTRCTAEAEAISTYHAETICRITKNPINTMASLPKLLWVMKHEPETWEETDALIYPKDYIVYRLTGSLQTDHSDASGSLLYDLKRRAWSDEICRLFSIDMGKLPPIRPSAEVVGIVTPAASRSTGIAPGTPVVAGGSDAVTELFAAGIRGPSGCKIRLGTSGALSTVTDNIDEIQKNLFYVWSYLDPTQWMLDINTRSCAQATVWLRNLAFGGAGTGDAGYRTMEREASSVAAGAEGVTFHPYLMGEDAPYWDVRLRGSFSGISPHHTRGHFVRAVYEGTAFALRDALGCLGKRGEGFTEFILVGGGVKNRLWTTIVLDVLGVDGKVPDHAGAAFGAAMLAGIGIGFFEGCRDAVKVCRGRYAALSHSADNHVLYTRHFERYKRMKELFDPIYEIS